MSVHIVTVHTKKELGIFYKTSLFMKSVSVSFIWATKWKLQSYQASILLMGYSEEGMSEEFH